MRPPMTLLHQAAQKAVEQLKRLTDGRGGIAHFARTTEQAGAVRELIAALESALQQPEPVAFYCDKRDLHHQQKCPQQCAMCADSQGNTAPPALQHQEVPREPVAEVLSYTNGSYSRNYKLRWIKDVPEGTKLYASPSTTRQQEVGSDALDARRYRWLRRADIDMSGLFTLSDDEATFKTGAPLDRAIDAAMLAAAPSTPEKAGGVKECPRCFGSGESGGGDECKPCGGRGKVSEQRYAKLMDPWLTPGVNAPDGAQQK